MQKEQHKSHYRELTFVEMIIELWKNAAWILLIAGVAALISFCAAKIANIGYYRSEFTFYAFSSSTEYSAEDVAEGYAKMAVTSDFLKYAVKQTEIEADYKELKQWVDVVQTPDTAVVTVGVTMKDPEQAYELAKALSEVLPEYESYVQYGTLTITQEPELPETTCRNSIKWTKWVVVGFSVTFLLVCFYVSVCALVDVPNRFPPFRLVLRRLKKRLK